MSEALPELGGSSGFVTTQPEGRVARAARKDRDQRTRLVLAQRREGHARPGEEIRSGNPLRPVHGVGVRFAEPDRLRTDCGGEVRRTQDALNARKQQKWDKLRGIRCEKEAGKWARQEDWEGRQKTRGENLVGSSKRNAGSVRYNLINHHFRDPDYAAIANYKDNMTQYTAVCRAKDLYAKDNRSGYNIITGDARRTDLVKDMSRPERPANLKSTH
eukprot:TRINITY_DN22288_c0_g1_i1.p2 TRINITY_DN22288_c0_g1~~TRINITY_DN22288_c0_g1_i1.p2  ORF type:complete len:216 (+),score=75.16 TRINITY_DN22288_c0_g1_i1:90-737(+)